VQDALLTTYTTTYNTDMNIEDLLKQSQKTAGTIDIIHYTNLILLEACRLIKDTPTTAAFTTFDQAVAETQRADCFKQVYNQIVENIKDGNNS
jgi:hypothetical protein